MQNEQEEILQEYELLFEKWTLHESQQQYIAKDIMNRDFMLKD